MNRKSRIKTKEQYRKVFISRQREKAKKQAIAERFGSYYDEAAYLSYLESDEGKNAVRIILENNADYDLAIKKRESESKAFNRDYKDYVAREKKKEKKKEIRRRKLEEAREIQRKLMKSILEVVPDNYIDLYPFARSFKRHFVLHLGPTNSGKTYAAINDLIEAESGIYLAPLRLLAYEQFENMNSKGCLTTLLTGEESISVPFSKHQSSTIEMLDTAVYYDCVVIDEAQMANDSSRGDAWTTAILGAASKKIHICAAEYAEDMLVRLIESCGDTYEINYHKRQIPLVMEEEEFKFPKDIKKGDALILFSRKDVHACAADLQRKGIKTSLIYGALPYEVRHNEAKKFLNGETDVVVATDAIGMGLNMPIKRVVFLETSKFDGSGVRGIYPEEVKQIAGRAGRRGLFDIGYVTSIEEGEYIESCLNVKIPQIESAIIGLPKTLLDVDADLHTIIEQWNKIPDQDGFKKADLTRELNLCRELEKIHNDKYLIYRFITMPFDETKTELKAIWLNFFIAEAKQKKLNLDIYIPKMRERETNLNTLEAQFHICDLIYYYVDRFSYTEYHDVIMSVKRAISEKIMDVLSKQKLIDKKCRVCGARLPWNYKYSICNKCYLKKFYY